MRANVQLCCGNIWHCALLPNSFSENEDDSSVTLLAGLQVIVDIIQHFHRWLCLPAPVRCCSCRGHGAALHELEKTWRFRHYLLEQRECGRTWRELFWQAWGVLTVLDCVRCGRTLPAADFLQECSGGGSHQVGKLLCSCEE